MLQAVDLFVERCPALGLKCITVSHIESIVGPPTDEMIKNAAMFGLPWLPNTESLCNIEAFDKYISFRDDEHGRPIPYFNSTIKFDVMHFMGHECKTEVLRTVFERNYQRLQPDWVQMEVAIFPGK